MEQSNGEYDHPYKYNVKELDEATGLYYYGARYYDRILLSGNRRPSGGEISAMGPYNYALQNPIKMSDL